MQLSDLELRHYFITDLSLSANPKHDPKESVRLDADDLTVESGHSLVEGEDKLWQIRLNLRQDDVPGSNMPYSFTLHMIGYVAVSESVPEESREHFIAVNGAAVLYGAAREGLRGAMSQGPYKPVLLPSVNFAAELASKETAGLVKLPSP